MFAALCVLEKKIVQKKKVFASRCGSMYARSSMCSLIIKKVFAWILYTYVLKHCAYSISKKRRGTVPEDICIQYETPVCSAYETHALKVPATRMTAGP